MKKIILLFITLILFIPNVYAFKEGDRVTVQTNGSISYKYKYYSNDTKNLIDRDGSIDPDLNFKIFKAKYQDISYDAYCIDPNSSASLTDVVVKQIISNKSKLDYGTLAIIKEAQKNSYQYNDILLALRLYTNYVWKDNTTGYDSRGYGAAFMRAHLLLFQEIVRNNNLEGVYQSITGRSIENAANGHGYGNGRSGEVPIIYYGANNNNVAKLVTAALNATNDGGDNVDIPKVTMKKEKETERDDKKTIVISVKLENFDFSDESKSTFIYTGIEGNDSVTLRGYSNDGDSNDLNNLPVNSNIFDKFKKGKHTIYLTYEVDLRNIKDNEDECAFAFKINYKYQDVNFLQGAVVFSSSPGSDYQRYIIFESDEIISSFDVNGDCDKDKCEATTNYPEICQDGAEIDGEGNAHYEFHEGTTGDGEYDIVKCILANKDMADNSYKLNDSENASVLNENPYCSVYCKEDYSFSVPYKRETLSGRFFQIDMGIKGQKTCYSSQINYKAYKNDIIKSQEYIYEQYNEYLKNRDIEKKLNLKVNKEQMYTYTTTEDGKKEVKTPAGLCLTWTISYNQVDKKGPYENGVISIGTENPSNTESFGSLTTAYSIDGGKYDNCVSGETEWTKYNATQKKNTAIEHINAAVEDMKSKIDDFNGCSGSRYFDNNHYSKITTSNPWKISYNFNPDVTYLYDEPIGYESKWITPGNGYDKMIVLNQKTEANVCGSNSNCSVVDSIQDIFDENKTIDTTVFCTGFEGGEITDEINKDYTCKSPVEYDAIDPRNYLTIICPGNICTKDSKTYDVTQVRYVKQTARGEITLTTPRVFFSRHDDGNILIGNYDITPDNHDRVNGLPVAATTPRGQYFYILSIDNLGEFYDNPKNLGRIFSKNLTNNVMDKIENRPTNYAVSFDIQSNEYACTYIVKHHCVNETDGTIHTEAECKIGEDWTTCSQRICGCDNPPCTWNGNELIIPDDPDPSNPPFNLNISFRPISPNNIKPNVEPMGYNWNTMIGNLKNHLIAIKAGNTIAEIKNRNNIDNVENLSPGDIQKIDDYNFKIKLTPSMVTWIKKYNDENEDKGSFGNNTLDCTSYILESINNEKECTSKGYNWDNGQCQMANIFCTSTFIDELMDPDNGFSQYIDAPGRDKAKDTAASNFHKYKYLQGKLQNDDKIVTNDYWTIYIYDQIDYLYDGDKKDGLASVGPSWK